MVVGLLGNISPDLNRFTLVTPKSENDVRLQATLANQNPTGLPVGTVRQTIKEYISDSRELSQTDLLYEVFATFIRVNSSWKGEAYEI